MNKKSINRTIKELIEFQESARKRDLTTYAVTLTYRTPKSNSDVEKTKDELPNQKEAINIDMKKFKDNILKYYKRNNINFECFFIFSIYNEDTNTIRPHFHGIIALSKPKRIKDIVHKYWGNGFVYTKKFYSIGWIDYIIKNISESEDFYEKNLQIKSRTRKL